MFGLDIADIVVIACYLAGITALGVWMARRVRTMGDFIMPHRFGKFTMAMHGFGTGTHTDHAVGVVSKTFTSGLSGIWYQWLYLFATPFYWLIAPIMRRFRALTTADVFAARYNQSVAVLYAVVGVLKHVRRSSDAHARLSRADSVNTKTRKQLVQCVFGVSAGVVRACVRRAAGKHDMRHPAHAEAGTGRGITPVTLL